MNKIGEETRILENEVTTKAKLAKEATERFFPSTAQKNELLSAIADRLEAEAASIIEANEQDLQNGKQNGISKALLDRLALNEERIASIAHGLRQIVDFADPIGDVIEQFERPNGLQLEKKRVPIGVIGIIYEARPNVTVDAAGLCLKTGNAVILRGGSAALKSNQRMVAIMHEVMKEKRFPCGYVQLIEDTDRSSVTELLQCLDYVDLLIPRGGRSLIQHVVQHAKVPVIETGEGICHVYIHEQADAEKARSITVNAKCQRPSVCNAAETVLIDAAIAVDQLPRIAQELQQQGVEIRGCSKTKSIIPDVIDATEEDWQTEYNDYIVSIKVVSTMNEALDHIRTYGTKHSEAIITEDSQAANTFLEQVDAAAVYHNASTRFTDGFEFGFGAEIGISTQKLHARGPMGLNELTSIKYCIRGNGQIK